MKSKHSTRHRCTEARRADVRLAMLGRIPHELVALDLDLAVEEFRHLYAHEIEHGAEERRRQVEAYVERNAKRGKKSAQRLLLETKTAPNA
jgi:hypothetical protein